MTHNHVATLIAAPGTRLDATLLGRARITLPRAEPPAWLERGVAADIPFSADAPIDQREAAERLREFAGGAPIDAVVQPTAHQPLKADR